MKNSKCICEYGYDEECPVCNRKNYYREKSKEEKLKDRRLERKMVKYNKESGW